MAKKRSNIEVSADILRAAISGIRKSHIVYQTNLNNKLADRYIDDLRKSELIVGPIGRGKIFSTTEKGRKYIQLFDDLQECGIEAD